MRPIPAPRLGDTHGLLRAISQRERLRLDEFVTEFSVEDLFPPVLENALGRTRQFVSFARAAGLVKEDRGIVELSEIGKRYVKSADPQRFFDVSSGQAEWLRRQLREKHMTDSIYHGAAIGLSLLASSPPDFRVGTLDFGRALAYLARAGWDNDNTFQSQGERYAVFLADLELIDGNWRLTPTGEQTRAELTLPIHMSLKDLAGQLNPGGVEAAVAGGEADWRARAPAAPGAPPPEWAPPAPPMSEEDEYEDVGPGAGPSPAAAPAPQPQMQPPPPAPEPVAEVPVAEPPAPPPVPGDVWDTAAPDEVTRSYGTVSPEIEEATAAASGRPPGAPRPARRARPPPPPPPPRRKRRPRPRRRRSGTAKPRRPSTRCAAPPKQ